MTMCKISSLVKNRDIIRRLKDPRIKNSLELLENSIHPKQRSHLAETLKVEEKTVSDLENALRRVKK